MVELLRTWGPMVLALLAAWAVDASTAARGLVPPGFRWQPTDSPSWILLARMRRGMAFVLVAGVLWLGVFLPLAVVGQAQEVDYSGLGGHQLFVLHGLFLLTLVLWYLLGFAPPARGAASAATAWMRQLGLRTPRPLEELGIGLASGVLAWLLVVAVLLLAGLALYALGREEVLPREPPAMVEWIVGLPVLLRIGVSVSAGVVEELFFRGFLQPRVGILLSSLFFVLAHATYEQPLMLVGVAILSVVFALLVRWRQNVWAAVTAHFLFDLIQLLVVIPAALEVMQGEAEASPALLWPLW